MSCALCNKEAELQKSHIIPKLVYSRIKGHKKSRFRSLDNITKILQDGEKRPMLCHDCEELFSAFEVKFANKFLNRYLDDSKVPRIRENWLDIYILSVAWRVLWDDLYRMKSHENHFVRGIFEEFCGELGIYLLSINVADNPIVDKRFVNKIYQLDSLVKNTDLNKVAEGMLFGYSVYFGKSNSVSVIVYYAGLVFVTDYIYDKRKYVFIGTGPILFKKRFRRKEIIVEINLQFHEILQQYSENVTPELQEKIKKYYATHE